MGEGVLDRPGLPRGRAWDAPAPVRRAEPADEAVERGELATGPGDDAPASVPHCAPIVPREGNPREGRRRTAEARRIDEGWRLRCRHVKDSPGKADYAAFYLKAAEKGLIVAGDPRQAKAQPGQAKSMTGLYRQMARLGVPYLIEIDFKMGGEGPMGALMGKLGFGFTSTVTRVSVAPIPAALIAVPADYKLVKRN
jgi:hypothetical protein